jgi:hypothetical protein
MLRLLPDSHNYTHAQVLFVLTFRNRPLIFLFIKFLQRILLARALTLASLIFQDEKSSLIILVFPYLSHLITRRDFHCSRVLLVVIEGFNNSRGKFYFYFFTLSFSRSLFALINATTRSQSK